MKIIQYLTQRRVGVLNSRGLCHCLRIFKDYICYSVFF